MEYYLDIAVNLPLLNLNLNILVLTMADDYNAYTPIKCGLHSEYELAIMHKQKCILKWNNANNIQQTETILPLDIFTKNKQEFLKFITTDNTTLEIRLDKIIDLRMI